MNNKNNENSLQGRMTRFGIYALSLVSMLLAVLLLLNLLVASLPVNFSRLDITENKIYSLSATTKRQIAKVERPVEVYLLVEGGQAALSKSGSQGIQMDAFLANLAASGKKLSYRLIDPAADAEALTALGLTSDSVSDLSVVVKSPLRSRVLTASSFYSLYVEGVGKVDETTAAYYYYYYSLTPTYVFDGENQMMAAIEYVSDPELPVVYTLSGHSETALSDTLSSQLTAAGIQPSSVSLASLTAVPEDCRAMVIHAPQSDLTDSELSILMGYIADGGSVILITAPDTLEFPNLAKLAASQGMLPEIGIVVETDSNNYYSAQYPYYLMLAGKSALLSSATVCLPFAHGITISSSLPQGVTVTPIYSTSDGAYLVSLEAETLEKPEEAEAHTIHTGVMAENSAGGRLIWLASNGFLDDSVNQTSGTNQAAFMTAVTTICGTGDIPTVAPIDLSASTLTVDATTAGLLSTILVILVPLSVMAYGAVCVVRRKRR